MKCLLPVLLLPVAAMAAPPLSVDMNGEYRCDNGRTFTAKTLNAAVIDSELMHIGSAETRNGHSGAGHTAMRNDITGFDLYGAGVTLDGKVYRLMLAEGDVLTLRDRNGSIQWDIGAPTAPYAGRLRLGPELVGENCIKTAALAAPQD